MTDPSWRLTPVVRIAPAKLNLTLAVVGRRPDGFHALHSVMVPLALADRVSLAVLPDAAGDDTLHCEGFAAGPDGDNLVRRAIQATRQAVRSVRGIAPPLAARLEKKIPVAAGLAGGSSDAAAVIDGALEAWGGELDDEERLAIATHLGSDVPFFLAGGAALVEGRGERVTPLHGLRDAHGDGGRAAGILLVTPPVAAGLAGGSSDAAAVIDGALEAWGGELDDEERLAIATHLGSDVPFFLAGGAALVEGRGERVTPLHGLRDAHGDGRQAAGILLVTPPVAAHTASVFAAWGSGAMGEPGVARRTSEHFASEFGSGLTLQALVERAGVLASANDLWPAAAAVVPGLVGLRRGLARLLSRPIGLSGSGPTLWALYPSLADAESAAAAVRDALRSKSLDSPGDGEPFVAATTMVTRRVE